MRPQCSSVVAEFAHVDNRQIEIRKIIRTIFPLIFNEFIVVERREKSQDIKTMLQIIRNTNTNSSRHFDALMLQTPCQC
jgi:hypothetical protein